jgi:hypothetical protein
LTVAISTVDASYIQAAPGQLYLIAAPSSVAGADLAAQIETLFDLFYDAPVTARYVMTSNTPWAALSADGFKAKLKQVPVEFDPNDGPKYTVGYQHLEATAEVTIADVSATKLAEIMSVAALGLVTTAAGASIAARTTVALGGESAPNLYTALYRYPSKKVANEFDNVLIPFCTFEIDTDYELSKKAVRQAKLTLKANSNGGLVWNRATGRPVYWIEDRATAVASSAPH